MAILVARTNLPVWDFQKLASLVCVLLVCVAGEAWESYTKLNCFRCHGENHRTVWWTFHSQFKTSNDPTVADSPDAIYSIQGCCFEQCLFWGRTKWGDRTTFDVR